MELIICTDKIQWDLYVSESPQGNVFCTTAFLDSLLVEYELMTLQDNGRILLGFIIFKKNNEILKAPYPFTMYQGILCCNDFSAMPFHKRSAWLLDKLTTLFIEMERKYNRISFCLSHKFDDLRGFQWFHYHEPIAGMFKIDLRYTGILDLNSISDFEIYLSLIRSVRRQEYHRAINAGFTIEMTNDIEILNRLHSMTFERQGISRGNEEELLVLNISKIALEKGFGELLVSYDKNGVAASATLFLYDKFYGYYLFGANNPEYRKFGVGTLLIVENIRRCMGKKLTGIDFVGINSPNRGDFKTSFNAKPVPYYITTWDKP
jgi:lipid II:glycine glycyltransferase (peptidoglycan interpeptide bridge formation enzyme)